MSMYNAPNTAQYNSHYYYLVASFYQVLEDHLVLW